MEFVRLIQGVKHFIAGDGDGGSALDAAFDLDMAGGGLLPTLCGGIGGDVPPTFLSGDIHNATALCFLGPAYGFHREAFNSAASGRVGGKGASVLDWWFAAKAAEQSGRNNQRTT